ARLAPGLLGSDSGAPVDPSALSVGYGCLPGGCVPRFPGLDGEVRGVQLRRDLPPVWFASLPRRGPEDRPTAYPHLFSLSLRAAAGSPVRRDGRGAGLREAGAPVAGVRGVVEEAVARGQPLPVLRALSCWSPVDGAGGGAGERGERAGRDSQPTDRRRKAVDLSPEDSRSPRHEGRRTFLRQLSAQDAHPLHEHV